MKLTEKILIFSVLVFAFSRVKTSGLFGSLAKAVIDPSGAATDLMSSAISGIAGKASGKGKSQAKESKSANGSTATGTSTHYNSPLTALDHLVGVTNKLVDAISGVNEIKPIKNAAIDNDIPSKCQMQDIMVCN